MNQEAYDAIVAFYGYGPFDVKGVNTCGVSSLHVCLTVFSMWFQQENISCKFRLRVSLYAEANLQLFNKMNKNAKTAQRNYMLGKKQTRVSSFCTSITTCKAK